MTRREQITLYWTTDYERFSFLKENRDADTIERRKKLKETRRSIEENGFLRDYPVVVKPAEPGFYSIIDGQGRFVICRDLQIEFAYIINNNFKGKISSIQTGKPWGTSDYVKNCAAIGSQDYTTLREWSRKRGIQLAVAAQMLSGRSPASTSNLEDVRQGRFQINNMEFANKVADLLDSIRPFSILPDHRCFINAVASCAWLPFFDCEHFAKKCKSFPSLLVRCLNTEQYLEVIETIYNYHDKGAKVAIKFPAMQLTENRRTENLNK